jgi:hypothetical protein
MKRKILVFSVIFTLFAMLALSGPASAWMLTGTITKIENWTGGYMSIEVNTGSYICKRGVDPTLTATDKNQILAIALTAKSNGDTVDCFVNGSNKIDAIAIK